jgi:hypothetical protein
LPENASAASNDSLDSDSHTSAEDDSNSPISVEDESSQTEETTPSVYLASITPTEESISSTKTAFDFESSGPSILQLQQQLVGLPCPFGAPFEAGCVEFHANGINQNPDAVNRDEYFGNLITTSMTSSSDIWSFYSNLGICNFDDRDLDLFVGLN